MSHSPESKIRGAVLGLAFGDAMSFPSTTHRLRLLNVKRSNRMISLTQFAFDQKQNTYPTVYTHAQSVEFLGPRPTDDSEWLYFSADIHLSGLEPKAGWIKLANSDEDLRGRTGTLMALDNLKAGKMPPESGHDNPHYFDDMAMVRSLAAALIFRSNEALVLEKTRSDAEVTHSEDGIYCALALAMVATSLLSDESAEAAVDKALKQLPDGSWSQRVVADALTATSGAKSVTEVAYILEDVVIDRIYSYSISAPESLALILCYLRVAKTSNDFLLAGTINKRKLDSMPALLGAIAGLIHGDEWIPSVFIANGSELDGVCIPSLKGKSLSDLATRIIG